jgi:hypothetical protein
MNRRDILKTLLLENILTAMNIQPNKKQKGILQKISQSQLLRLGKSAECLSFFRCR